MPSVAMPRCWPITYRGVTWTLYQCNCSCSAAHFTTCLVYRNVMAFMQRPSLPTDSPPQAVWESGAASRLFTATVMTECTTQTAKMCVGGGFFCAACGLCACISERVLSLLFCVCMLGCLGSVLLCMRFYNCVHTLVCANTAEKVRIVWEELKRVACHLLNAPPPPSLLDYCQRPGSFLNHKLTYLSHFTPATAGPTGNCSALCGWSFDRL